MHWTLLACLALVAGVACDEPVMDTESVRQVVHSLLDGGELLSEESLEGIAEGYTGSVRDYLDDVKRLFAAAKAASEIFVRDQISDLEIVAELLKKLQNYQLTSKLGDAILTITKGPSRDLLEPFLNSGLRSGPLTLSSQMVSRINDVTSALKTFLAVATEELTQELLTYSEKLPAGHVKNFFVSLHHTIVKIEQEEEELEIPIDESPLRTKLTPVEIKADKGAFDQVLNKKNIQYVVDLLHDKQQAIAKIDELLKRDFESADLPKILTAIRECLG